jgi:hypothetical protein
MNSRNVICIFASTHNVFSWDRRPTSGAKVPERFILNNCLQGSKVCTIKIIAVHYIANEWK